MTRTDTLRGCLIAACLWVAVSTAPARGETAAVAAMSTVTLTWTAPGDDGVVGVAARYDVRYSLSPITDQDFEQATLIPDLPAPKRAGIRQSVKVSGLEPNRIYYFALKTVDHAGNWSSLSTLSYKTISDATRPSAALELRLSPPYPSPARNFARLDLSLPRATVVHINVIDVAGRLVRTLAEGSYPAGLTPLFWVLNDKTGARLSMGQYWILGVLGERTFVHRLTVLP